MSDRYLVSYDLHHQSKTTYDDVNKAIEQCGDTCHFQESVWVVASDHDATRIREAVDAVARAQDKVLVVKFTGTSRQGHGKELSDWLKRNPTR